MNEIRECPKCRGTMEIGFLSGAARWQRGKGHLTLLQVGPRIFAYACRNCAYVEFYLEQKGGTRTEQAKRVEKEEGKNRLVRT